MARQFAAGDLGDGTFGIRSALPGVDAFTEPFGSPNISFDSRLTDICTVIATGLITCDGAAVPFAPLPYVPPVIISRWDGTNCHITDAKQDSGTTGKFTWLPALAIVSNSAIRVISFTTPWYNVQSFFNPSGQPYLYSVFSLE